MKIALIGATGFVGSAVLKEALDREHEVTAIVRNPAKLNSKSKNLWVVKGDVMNTDELAALLKGNDVVISAYNSGWTNSNIYNEYMQGAQSIQAAVKKSGIKRLLVVGGAGSLYVAPGVQIVDTKQFPEMWKGGSTAARDYFNIIQKENELDWSFMSPPPEMNPKTSGIRTGHYRTGSDNPVFDKNHRSSISVDDLAVAILDEVENSKHIRKRFTVAY